MKINACHWSKLSKFYVDRFTAPVGQIPKDLCIIEVDISMEETQVFLIDLNSMTLFLENNFWVQDQVKLIGKVLKIINCQNLKPEFLVGRTVLLGVWHFGHFLGDHAHNLIRHYRRDLKGSCGYPIHISSRFSGLNHLSELLTLPRLRYDVTSNSRAKSSTRIYRLIDCICIYPAIDKAIPLSIAQTHVRLSMPANDSESVNETVFLTSCRTSRISNVNKLTAYLAENSWRVLNPLTSSPATVLDVIKKARLLVCENGSILFNCFLAREKRYFVLGSTRILDVDKKSHSGGAIYNRYHDGILEYIPFPPLTIKHHPFSDQIAVPSILFSKLRRA